MPNRALAAPTTLTPACAERLCVNRLIGWLGAVAHGSYCITLCDTIGPIVHAISVRLDDEAERALRSLEATGMTRSEAIRAALVDSARRLRQSSKLAAEAAALEADEADREEMLSVAALMESLRAPG